MANLMKHVGKFGEKPCVVVFREVPNEPNNCLIVETSTLTNQKHDDLMNVVQSLEAQESNDISEVLSRRQFTDGSNMLNDLHLSKKLQKVETNLVFLTPTPSEKISLSDVNKEINKIKNQSNPPLKTEVDPVSVDTMINPDPVDTTTTTDNGTEPEAVARNILMQADLMTEDANKMLAEAEAKRNEAFELDPSLKPKKGPGRPPKNS
jgi:predicted ATP-dependent endonuclease of OLD family